MSDARGSPEIALLLRCATSDEVREAREEARARARAVSDWQLFLRLATRHAVVPLLDRELARTAADIVPPDIMTTLRAGAQQGAMRSLQLTGELVAAMRALVDSGVDAMPFKGPTLAAIVYGNLSLRQFEDLDILVPRRELERARNALLAVGYAPVLPLSEDQRASIVMSGHHEQLAHAATGTTVELHWSLNNRALTHDSFEHHWWEDRQPVSIGGVMMRTLGPERLLLYLCMHGGKHSWRRLSWLCDLQRALHAFPNADWKVVWRLAEEDGAARMVSIGLSLVAELFGGASLTKAALSGRSTDADAGQVSSLIARRIRAEENGETAIDFRLQLRSRERRRDRLRYTWHILATPHPADVVLVGLPRMLHGVYYIARPLRLIWKHLVRRSVTDTFA